MRYIIALTLSLFSLLSQAIDIKSVAIERQHIKSIALVAPMWEDYTNKDGTGLYWDIAKAVYEPLGIKVKTTNIPWNRAMKMVSKYRTFSAIVGETLDTDEQVIFPIYPIDVEYMAVLSKNKEGVEWDGMASLKNQKVGWIKNYDVVPANVREFKLKEFRNIEQGIRLLDSEKIDFLIDEWDEIAAAMQKQGMSMDDYSINEMPNGSDVYLAFSVDNISRELIAIYNERIPQLVANGELAAIYEKWDTGEMPEIVMNLTDGSAAQ